MKIEYLGHSCFALTSDAGTRIVTDPYGDIGFSMPNVSADAVTVSHGHYDHCNVAAVSGSPRVLQTAGTFRVGDIEVTAAESFHDDVGGRKRGKNLIFTFSADGLKVCHAGDLGEPCSPARAASLSADVLLLPVGGVYTVDAAGAKAYVSAVKPPVLIPMHYKVKGLNIPLGGVSLFTSLFPAEEAEVVSCGPELRLSSASCGAGKIKIIVMERKLP